MAIKTVLNDEFTGDGASNPVLYNDAMMSAGSLILLDGAHSMGGFDDTGGAVQQNVAWATAAAIIGAGTETTLSPNLLTSGTVANGIGREITTKGGLHVACKQNGDLAEGDGIYLSLPSEIEAYLLANSGHSFYMSIWADVTRIGVEPINASGYPMAHVVDITGSTGNFVNLITSKPADNTYEVGARRTNGNNGSGIQMLNVANSQATGTLSNLRLDIAAWGQMSAWESQLNSNPEDVPSWVLYRLYLEDLTVSGRTYLEVDALDYAAYQAAFGSGGRFNGDTYTAAAILAGA